MTEENRLHHLLIVSITPYFLEKEVSWFTENLEKILSAQKTQTFFQDNSLYIEAQKNYQLFEILRKLDEMGYEKVFEVESPGEFAQRGGLLEVFPINRKEAVQLDFLGNTLEHITQLDITVADEQKSKEILKKRLQNQELFSDIKNLKEGEYLVHLDHGVGQYIRTEKLGGQEYYVLSYAKEDKLYVPVGLERKLSRYVGFASPAVARLGSTIWQSTKRKIKEEVEQLAQQLLQLYAKKETAVKVPYEMDYSMEEQLREGFPYEETPDQAKAIEDIKKDLQQSRPMDRIVLGDVGFGKTEIAIRAAFFAALNGHQTAVICPTTILASQHFNNFKRRLESFPIRIALLSRLQTKKEQQEVITGIKEGNIDIVIGTHRILSKDMVFKKLQLLILDDEQRFGVKQKEKLREQNPALDMLSLSATPIPRTIYLAMSSFKNMSVIQTPPQGRSAIRTHILPYNEQKIAEAIRTELSRGGQVYFLHNRVQTIETVKEKLHQLVPEASFAIIHGRMPEGKLVKVMSAFQKKELNVLIATTIIENGIDLPNVNTIIVEDASRLGLSQAYQIRGRVGRSPIEGFAYLFYPNPTSHKASSGRGKITPMARERLKALKEAKELGAGYRIAMKDLELRGAGNILGKEQSGAINKVGLNLYCQMLAEAIEKQRQ